MKFRVSERTGETSREIQDVSLAELQGSVTRAKKTRSVKDADLDDLIASIKKNGVVTPIMIRADGTIVDGLCRIIAATRAGRTTIPAIVLES